MKIVFATGNAHKLQEINEIAAGTNIEFILPPDGFDPVEDGKTFEENSLIKAREAARLSGMISLADDSGLCVEALDGAPGIHSARYAETPQARINKLLEELRHCEERVNSTSQSHNEITTQSKIARNDTEERIKQMAEKISVKVCLGTTCFVMGSSNLQELIETVPAKYGDKVEVSGVPCLGLCSIDWEFSKAPYVKVDDEVIKEATVEKVLSAIDAKLK